MDSSVAHLDDSAFRVPRSALKKDRPRREVVAEVLEVMRNVSFDEERVTGRAVESLSIDDDLP
jgi:hypothetical protein